MFARNRGFVWYAKGCGFQNGITEFKSGYQLSLVIRHSCEDCLWWELPAKAGIQNKGFDRRGVVLLEK